MYLIPKQSPYLTHIKPKMEMIAKKIKAETGEDSYLMTVGGSTCVGLFGYITAFQELIDQVRKFQVSNSGFVNLSRNLFVWAVNSCHLGHTNLIVSFNIFLGHTTRWSMRVKKKACRKIVPVLQEISCGNTVMILSR
jgi:hypothetical protein